MRKLSGKRVTVPLLILCLGCSGCLLSRSPESFPVQGRLIRQLERACSSGKACKVRMNDLTDFNWDRMYVFAVGVSPSERREIAGADGVETIDLEGELVFTKAGRIVHQEPVAEGVERPIKDEISFAEITNTGESQSYPPDIVFAVKQGTSKNGSYFSLKAER